MATIAGTLLLGSGTPAKSARIGVRMASPPLDLSGVVRSGRPEVFSTNSISGAYSFTLAAGAYSVFIRDTPEFEITVPTGTDTYTLGALAGTPSQSEVYLTADDGTIHAITIEKVGSAYTIGVGQGTVATSEAVPAISMISGDDGTVHAISVKKVGSAYVVAVDQ